MNVSISVITPSFNQFSFLPVCIESAQAQTRAPIEHMVIDPGSTDGTLEYLAGDPRITLIEGEDTSQSDAVNIGVRRASGDVVAWINSDDCYVDSNTFAAVGAVFDADPLVDIVYGAGDYIDSRGAILRPFYVNQNPGSLPDRIASEVGIAQPATFFRRALFDDIGPLNEQLTYSMDYDLWIRAVLAGKHFHYLNLRLAKTRVHGETKTFGSRDKSYQEVAENVTRHFGYLPRSWADRWAKSQVTETDGIITDPPESELTEERQRHIDATSRRILQAYNHGPTAQNALVQAAKDPRGVSARETLTRMKRSGDDEDGRLARPMASQPLLVSQSATAPTVSRPVNGVSHQYDQAMVDYQLERSNRKIGRLAATKSDRAVILGNGPSLLSVDRAILEDALVFGSNYVFLNEELWPEIDVLSISNPLVASQRAGTINMIDDATIAFPWWLSTFLAPRENTLLLKADGDITFATDVTERISWCHTVTYFSMQLAFSLGCREIVLAGFDHYYMQDKALEEGDTIEQDGADQNHFAPNYFGNKRWHAADVEGMEAAYRIAKEAFEADGRSVYNATDGGHLEVFQRASFEQLGPVA